MKKLTRYLHNLFHLARHASRVTRHVFIFLSVFLFICAGHADVTQRPTVVQRNTVIDTNRPATAATRLPTIRAVGTTPAAPTPTAPDTPPPTTPDTPPAPTAPPPDPENRSGQFDDVLAGEITDRASDALAQAVRDQRAAFDQSDRNQLAQSRATQTAATKTIIAASIQLPGGGMGASNPCQSAMRGATISTGSVCDADMRKCMAGVCGNDFMKCALDTDSVWGNKIQSCRIHLAKPCPGPEYTAVITQIRADRDNNVRVDASCKIMQCGNDFNECMLDGCGTGLFNCLGKAGGDQVLAGCNAIYQKCQNADSGLRSRALEVFANVRSAAEVNVETWRKRLAALRGDMETDCLSSGGSFDRQSLGCVYSVELHGYIDGDRTLLGSKQLNAGTDFTCSPDWFGIDVTTFRENAARYDRASKGATAAVMGAGFGMLAGAGLSGAMQRAVDTQKAENALKDAQKPPVDCTDTKNCGKKECKDAPACQKPDKDKTGQDQLSPETQKLKDMFSEDKFKRDCKNIYALWDESAGCHFVINISGTNGTNLRNSQNHEQYGYANIDVKWSVGSKYTANVVGDGTVTVTGTDDKKWSKPITTSTELVTIFMPPKDSVDGVPIIEVKNKGDTGGSTQEDCDKKNGTTANGYNLTNCRIVEGSCTCDHSKDSVCKNKWASMSNDGRCYFLVKGNTDAFTPTMVYQRQQAVTQELTCGEGDIVCKPGRVNVLDKDDAPVAAADITANTKSITVSVPALDDETGTPTITVSDRTPVLSPLPAQVTTTPSMLSMPTNLPKIVMPRAKTFPTDALFDLGRYNLNAAGETAINNWMKDPNNQLLAVLQQDSNATVIITGFTDKMPFNPSAATLATFRTLDCYRPDTKDQNDCLSYDRAVSVQAQLYKLGVPIERTKIAGRGSRDAVQPYPGTTDEQRAPDRKVTIEVRTDAPPR